MRANTATSCLCKIALDTASEMDLGLMAPGQRFRTDRATAQGIKLGVGGLLNGLVGCQGCVDAAWLDE